MQMLHMLAKDGYVALKWEAEDICWGVMERDVKNLLYSRILEEAEDDTDI